MMPVRLLKRREHQDITFTSKQNQPHNVGITTERSVFQLFFCSVTSLQNFKSYTPDIGSPWNFGKKMKFKIRLVAGNGIWPAKIRPEGPLNPLESACKILWPHLKNSWKKSQKTYPPKTPLFFWGGELHLKPTLLDNIHLACFRKTFLFCFFC